MVNIIALRYYTYITDYNQSIYGWPGLPKILPKRPTRSPPLLGEKTENKSHPSLFYRISVAPGSNHNLIIGCH